MSTSETPTATLPPSEPQPSPNSLNAGRRSPALFAALLVAFAIGGGVTAAALQVRRPAIVMLTARAHHVHARLERSRGERSGRRVQDDSGRALVDTGRSGETGNLVAKSETVTVQGRFEHGSIHAQAISHPDGRNDFVGPLGPPPPPGGPIGARPPNAP